jgi:hypothetical protein
MNKLLSGLCALALLTGVTAACNQTESDRVGRTPDRTTPPSASPGTTTTPGSGSTTSGSGSATGTTGSGSSTTSPSGSATGSGPTSTTTR